MISYRRYHTRRGSALLVCTLAATVLSMATVAILRCNTRNIAKIDARRASLEGRATADGLLQRTIAMMRIDPTLAGTVLDPRLKGSEAWVEVTPIDTEMTAVAIYLYTDSKAPAIRTVVELAKL